jgi:hypothetical protein
MTPKMIGNCHLEKILEACWGKARADQGFLSTVARPALFAGLHCAYFLARHMFRPPTIDLVMITFAF